MYLELRRARPLSCVTSAVESPRDCWSSWVYSGESVRLPNRFLEEAESFTSLCFSTPIAASHASQATPLCWRTISKYRKGNSRQKRSPVPARRWPLMLLCSGRFPPCRASGSFPVSTMTWQPALLRSSYRRRGFVINQHVPTIPRSLIYVSVRNVAWPYHTFFLQPFIMSDWCWAERKMGGR